MLGSVSCPVRNDMYMHQPELSSFLCQLLPSLVAEAILHFYFEILNYIFRHFLHFKSLKPFVSFCLQSHCKYPGPPGFGLLVSLGDDESY